MRTLLSFLCCPGRSTNLVTRLQSWRAREREVETDLAFPDELDTPKDISAQERFQRYRGMRSFRTSPWDPYENLPKDYAKIFQFEDYRRTERAVRRSAEEETGTIVDVSRPRSCYRWYCSLLFF